MYPVPIFASMPPIAPPMPVKPVDVPISGPLNKSVGSAWMLATQNACPKVTKHVAAIAIHAYGTSGAKIAAGMQQAPSAITNFRARGNVQPARINLPESQPPRIYPMSPKMNGRARRHAETRWYRFQRSPGLQTTERLGDEYLASTDAEV